MNTDGHGLVSKTLRQLFSLPMNLVAADVSPLHLIRSDVRADSRRLLQCRDSRREKCFGEFSPRLGGARGTEHIPRAVFIRVHPRIAAWPPRGFTPCHSAFALLQRDKPWFNLSR